VGRITKADRLSEDERIALREEKVTLGLLEQHPGWLLLIREWEARREKERILFEAVILAGGPAAHPVDQRKVDYERGYWAGVRDCIDTPTRAKKWLRKEAPEEE
jgi:hypothetical protein